MGEFLITTDELAARVGCATAPVVIDVRRRAVFDSDDTTLPAARWRDHVDADGWAGALPAGAEVVVFCVHGHNVSQLATAILRQRGIAARTLAGGIEAYRAAGGHVVQKVPLVDWAGVRPSTWVTRARPKIDRIACPWLVRRFIDREARFLFVEPEHVVPVAEELGMIGVVAVLGGFLILAYAGVQVALATQDRFASLLAGGIVIWFVVQTIINVGGVTGLMPVTGLTLPFFSAGGSSLFVTMTAAGLLLNVARNVR